MEQKLTFCRMCHGRCSLLVSVEDGRTVKVAADRNAPPGKGAPCAKGLALPEMLNHPDRLKYPQKRQGPKAGGRWVRTSWGEALDIMAEKLNGLKRNPGPESVAVCLGDPKGLELAFAQRFASVFGTPNISTPGSICHMPGELASVYTFGSGCVADTGRPPACMVLWGSNLPHTRSGMPLPLFNAALSGGARLVTIDPRKTGPASRSDIWLRPRPGSDGALALGMIKVIIDERLHDADFVVRWSTGFAQLMEETGNYSLKDVEQATWVPEAQIAAAARLYAQTRPAVILWGNALDHSINSLQTCRAISILRAITGNVDVPGGEGLPSPAPVTRPGRFMLVREFPRNSERMAGQEFRLAARSAFIPRQALVKTILDEKPFPVKAGLLFGTNPLLSYPNAAETHRALMKLDFLVVADLFMTPTAMLADMVLPVAGTGEFDEVAPYPSSSGAVLAYTKVADPPGECWPDAKIVNELGKRLGLAEHFWPEWTQAFDYILEPAGLNFEQLKAQRCLQGKPVYRKHEAGGFRTPSGKAEIFSKQLEEFGYSPLPLFRELARTVALTAEYPLLLTSAKEQSFCHSAHRSIPALRKSAPEPLVELNPETARRLGLREDYPVVIETGQGRIRQKLALNDDLDPRVAYVSFGWWFPEENASSLYGWARANINILTPSAPPHEPGLGSVGLRSIPCRISPG
ncbi:MAG: molybdopterin-dependent oxidoreductase [Chloroflexota bacterium]